MISTSAFKNNYVYPILVVAEALGLKVTGRLTNCVNPAAHKNGDKNPSMLLYSADNRYRCLACDATGDSITLVRKVLDLSFQDALTWLKPLGVSVSAARRVPSSTSVIPAPRPAAPNPQISDVYRCLWDLSIPPTPASPAGRYLLGRGLDPVLAGTHGARELDNPDRIWQDLRARCGAEAVAAAVLVAERGDFLFRRHPLLFFYLDAGEPVFVQARAISGSVLPKELRPAGVSCPVPFNRDLLRTAPASVWVCEGCIDTLSALRLGYPAVGIPGVKSFHESWFELFRGLEQVVVWFDNDVAGIQEGPKLRAKFRSRLIRADFCTPNGATDVNELLCKTLSERPDREHAS
jgi:DNA primase